MRTKLDFGVEVDFLTKDELDTSVDRVLEHWRSYAEGLRWTRQTGVLEKAAGALCGPREGFVWMLMGTAAKVTHGGAVLNSVPNPGTGVGAFTVRLPAGAVLNSLRFVLHTGATAGSRVPLFAVKMGGTIYAEISNPTFSTASSSVFYTYGSGYPTSIGNGGATIWTGPYPAAATLNLNVVGIKATDSITTIAYVYTVATPVVTVGVGSEGKYPIAPAEAAVNGIASFKWGSRQVILKPGDEVWASASSGTIGTWMVQAVEAPAEQIFKLIGG